MEAAGGLLPVEVVEVAGAGTGAACNITLPSEAEQPRTVPTNNNDLAMTTAAFTVT